MDDYSTREQQLSYQNLHKVLWRGRVGPLGRRGAGAGARQRVQRVRGRAARPRLAAARVLQQTAQPYLIFAVYYNPGRTPIKPGKGKS